MATVVLLADSELALPSDNATGDLTGRVQAFGSFAGTFGTFEDFLEARTAAEAKLNADADLWQRSLALPAYVVRELEQGDTHLTIYGQVFDVETAVERERDAGASPLEIAEFQERIEDTMRRGWLWGVFYSTTVPGGELGCVHRAQLDHTLNAYEWDVARAEGWPS